MTNLYELSRDMLALQNEPDIPEEAIRDTLEAMEGEFNDKAVAVIKTCSNVEGDIEAIDSEIKRLQKRKQVKQNFINRFRDYLRVNMEQSGITKIEHSLFTITLGKPTKTADVFDDSKLPDEYTRTVIHPDKKAILADLKKGIPVPGAQLSEGKSRLLSK